MTYRQWTVLACMMLGISWSTAASDGPEAIADAFHDALTYGDATAIEALLAPDVKILEGDHAQTSRADYMSGHMKSDMAFIPYMVRTVLDRSVSADGDIAWVVTHSNLKGSFNDRDYDMSSRELLVMERAGTSWRITLVHWTDK